MRSFTPVFLWSDMFLWLLTVTVVAAFVVSYRNPTSRPAWRKVAARPAAMASLVVFIVFMTIGLVDSLHYRLRLADIPVAESAVRQERQVNYSVEVLSVLDLALDHLRSRNEKTYSAPLATHAYVKDTQTRVGDDDQTWQMRDYPRLQYGGAHLGENLYAKRTDLLHRLQQTGELALAVLMPVLLLIAVLVARLEQVGWPEALMRIICGHTELAWRALYLTLAAVIIIGSALYFLAIDYHPFGTDKVGADVLYQVLKSVRTALVIGLVTTVVVLPLALVLGICAGYFRGWIDDVIQYIYTTINSIPSVLLIAAAVLMMQVVIDVHPQWFTTAVERADIRLIALCLILGMTSWTSLARLLRGETLKLRELEYVQAARAFGVGNARILVRHILPNLMHIVIIALVMDFSGLVLAEAVLSYIGIGVDPTMHSFGAMINNARLELSREPVVWWVLVAAFVFMFSLVLAANLFADAVRDAFDPRASQTNH